ncbi:MAG: NADH-quinone oxidoreductase subunit K [Lentisphaerae bacterium RIFOXYB12_FULL_65_16]|nr:MAG: NADH-quinone oxidoreductase subunit K [Lentisphaerae bacterium RIFOXYA12_64_32]OGV93932.1 MAG: NADH-quinone oxidoreductase subunit K [Lentisphaerae bacterium RIFOXYB12_FULL_65_16]
MVSLIHCSDQLSVYLVIGALLFAIGFFGFLRHRTLIGMLISGEVILSGAVLNFMAFSRFLAPDPVTGQVFSLFIMGIAAAEATIILSILVAVYRHYRSVAARDLKDLEG